MRATALDEVVQDVIDLNGRLSATSRRVARHRGAGVSSSIQRRLEAITLAEEVGLDVFGAMVLNFRPLDMPKRLKYSVNVQKARRFLPTFDLPRFSLH